ncbi:polypyrimidine tract-binding protein homolog 3 [Tanacetum coccineum]
MASNGSERDMKGTLSKLLQMGTVAEYEREAFSLARILEARFEDEQSTISIAKPNKLTARVHLQDLEQTTQERGGEPNHILLVMIHHMIYPITMEVLHQVFSPLGVQLDIQFSNLEELQENQEEHICYYYWENYFSILNAEEADNTKPPLAADTFAKEVVDNGNGSALIFLVGYGTRSEVVTGLQEKF